MAAFTDEETTLLKKSIELRNRLIDNLSEGELPTDRRDIRLFMELLGQQDSSINTMANTRLKSKEIDENSDLKDAVVELLRSVSMENENYTSVLEEKDNIDIEEVEGLLDSEIRQIDPDELE